MNMWRKILRTAVMAALLCLTGLVMSSEVQAQRFVDNGNGTVTGQMWTQSANLIGRLPWNDAISACSYISISGIGGWRLPNMDELQILYHTMQGGHPFIAVQTSEYWSSTLYSQLGDFFLSEKANSVPTLVLHLR